MTFVEHAIKALDQVAQDPHAWVAQLIKLINETPTLADVTEMQGLESVKITYQKAPPAVIANIDKAFAQAFRRLGGTPLASAATLPSDEAGEEHDAPGTTTSDGVVAFSAWLVDHDGEPVSTKHGSGQFDNPAAYATALVDYLDNYAFPHDIATIEELNAQDAKLASNASPTAKAILLERQKRLAAPKGGPAAAEPAEPLVLSPPAGNTKAAWAAYTDKAQDAVTKLQTEADLDAWVAVNRPTYEALQSIYRMAVKQAVSLKRDELKRGAA
jgi:hypothetical protein